MIKKPRFLVKNYMRISGTRHSALDMARGRLVVISAFFVLAYIILGVRAFDLSVIQRVPHDQISAVPQDTSLKQHNRADILDRNGVILATSLETASLYADPSLIPDPAGVAKQLSDLFPDLVYGDVLKKLQRKGRFVWIKRSLTPDEQYSVLELGHPGLNFRTEQRRVYPQGGLVVHLLGYTDIDEKGLAGIEHSFNAFLSESKDPLTLTLDVRLQHILRRELGKAIAKFSAKGGAGTIVDIGSGEILAGVSLPDFDPHDPGAAKPAQIFNNLTLGVYELGSTFKIFSTAALLETHKVDMGYKFDTAEPLKRGRFTISDYHPEKRPLSVPEVFMYSSNIGSALMGEMVGTARLKSFYSDLGLMSPLPLEIDEIGRPLVPDPWRDINTLTASYGHGIAVSPLQMVMAASSIVNGGIVVKPTLILGKNKAELSQNNPDIRIISPQTAHRLRQLMRLVVTDGTGKNGDVPGFDVGGKTGTAEKRKSGGKGYDRHRKLSSFIGFFPMEAPRYAVFVMVDEPQGTKESFGYATGGWVAAPAVKNIITAMASVLGMQPNYKAEDDDLAASLKKYVSYKESVHASQ